MVCVCRGRLSFEQKKKTCSDVGHAAEEVGDLLGEVTTSCSSSLHC